MYLSNARINNRPRRNRLNLRSERLEDRVNLSSISVANVDTMLSRAGGIGELGENSDALRPTAAYNTLDNEFLTVWSADDSRFDLPNGQFEIFGRITHAETGKSLASEFRISNVAEAGDLDLVSDFAAVAWNSQDQEFLVVWQASRGGVIQVFGQRISPDGRRIGENFPISDIQDEFPVNSRARAFRCLQQSHEPIPSCLVVQYSRRVVLVQSRTGNLRPTA